MASVSSATLVSPAELLRDLLSHEMDPAIVPGGAPIGKATDAQQQAGCVTVVDAGSARSERYAPIVWNRAQIRCIAPTLEHTDRIGRHIFGLLHQRGRTEAHMVSTGDRFLIHMIMIVAGPSMHFDSEETWETLLFAEVAIGLDPITS